MVYSEEVPFEAVGEVGRFYFVYLLISLKDFSYYVGSTENLSTRLKDHNNQRSRYSSGKVPWKLIWYSAFQDKSKAYKFERYLKEGSGFAFRNKHLV